MSDTSHQDAIRFEQEMIVLGKLEELVESFKGSIPSLRDQFAMAALAGELANSESNTLGEACPGDYEATAMLCYGMADAMMEVRTERGEEG